MRRPKGEGSITQQSNGKYKVRVETNPVDGKRRWLTATVDTKSQAVAKLKELERQKTNETLIVTNRPKTLLLYIEEYLQSKLAMGVSLSTTRVYESDLTDMGKLLGDIPLNKLETNHFDKIVVGWRLEGLTERTIKKKIGTVSNMLDWCVYKGYLETNILSYHKEMLKRIDKHPDRVVEVLSTKEHEALKDAMKVEFDKFLSRPHWTLKEMFYCVYLLAYETGMRVGEIAALKWSDIEFDKCQVSVSRTLIEVGHGKEIEAPPKTKAGFRTIVVSEGTISVLSQLRDLYRERGRLCSYVFPSYRHKGLYSSTDAYRDGFKMYLSKVGIMRDFTFHDIRHTNASLMIHKGIPIPVVTERLGHSSVAVTYKTYAHAINDCEERRQAVIIA